MCPSFDMWMKLDIDLWKYDVLPFEKPLWGSYTLKSESSLKIASSEIDFLNGDNTDDLLTNWSELT